ncbi:Aste57867_16391 [Aphanomyces stellatus]|uniref:Aste57867_16391 protein n=1 Tax=Aphanomyces stellatus TaxID=120398 RepID=A0A485L6P9_9STRA|nr:hypothetical protein As57867_016334 [Aphanomyces stellatus]VFT93167.1 Aste57867_16391 [Aphanomyces stellatus]
MEDRSHRVRKLGATCLKSWALYLCLTSLGRANADATVSPDFPYCSKHIENNAIQRLATPDKYTLLQVQVIMRHGARTLASRSSCWAGYNVTWTCNARMHVAPHLDGDTTAHHVYDNKYVEGETVLKGNCHLGQLLDEGYNQELQNGRTFRKAYIDSNTLFRATERVDLSNATDFYLSSTDMQRTVMSGQLVVDAMFPPTMTTDAVVAWHVGDIAQSSFVPNEKSCPKLIDVKAQYEASAGYEQWLADHAPTVDLTKSIFHTYDPRILFDCLLTSRCSQPASLPSTLTPAQYDEIVFFERDKRMKIFMEDPTYAKLSMAKVLLAIRTRLLARVDGAIGPRFAFYSGHDDTVMPVLAALGGADWLHDWPPYAAYFAIELYEDAQSNFYVRFLYQGTPLTLPGCGVDSLCPLDVFKNATAYATDVNICATSLKVVGPTSATSPPTAADMDESETNVSFKALVLFVFVGVLLGVAFGLIIARALAKNGQGAMVLAKDGLEGPNKSSIQGGDDETGEHDELLSCQSPKHHV